MIPVTPPIHAGATLVVFAEDQEDYFPLPAAVDQEGMVVTEWKPNPEELELLIAHGGHVRLSLLHTGVHRGRPLTPIMVEIVLETHGLTH